MMDGTDQQQQTKWRDSADTGRESGVGAGLLSHLEVPVQILNPNSKMNVSPPQALARGCTPDRRGPSPVSRAVRAIRSNLSRSLQEMGLVAACCGLIAAAGCASLGTALQVTPDRVSAVTRVATYTACVIDLQENPGHVDNWAAAYGGLQALVLNEKWDAAALAQALTAAGVDRMICGEGSLIIGAVAIFVDEWTANTVELNKIDLVRAAVIGSRDGIAAALSVIRGATDRSTQFNSDATASRSPKYRYK